MNDPNFSELSDAELAMLRRDVSRRTAIYARQSRTNGSSYSSCQAQVGICRDMAKERQWIVSQVFTDEGQSSETLARPALGELIAAIEAGELNRLIVYSTDRLSRRLIDFHTLLEFFETHQVELVVVTNPRFNDSAADRLATNIIAAASQFQQELTRERMADARAALKRQGKRVAGRVPFGYKTQPFTKKLEPVPDQARIVNRFFRLAATGSRPSELADRANRNKWKDQNGKTGKWTARRVTALLSNPTYAGMIRNRDAVLPGEHEAIVERQMYDTVKEKLADRRTTPPAKTKRQRVPNNAKLRGIVICGQCERPMSTSVSHRGPRRYTYYRCRSTSGGRLPCPCVNIRTYELERFICDVLADPEDPESGIPRELRVSWSELDAREQERALTHVVQRIIYDHAAGRVTIELRDDWQEFLSRYSTSAS